MAELIVKATYKNNKLLMLRQFVRLSYPLWGIFSPVAAVVCFITGLIFLTGNSINFVFGCFVNFSLFATFSTIGTLLQTISMPSKIVLNSRGISLPVLIDQPEVSNKTIRWSEILHIDIYGEKKRKELVLFKSPGKAIKLPLSQIEENDLESLMTALELWAGPDKMRPDALELKLQTVSAGSFTSMWEEELARRFLPTVFVPLVPGRSLRQGYIRVVRQLAMGGLSAIYLCKENDKIQVVLKESVLPGSVEEETKNKAKEMFEREAILLAKLDHPGIVKVRDYFIEDARHYLVLDYLNGQDLRQLVLQNGARSESQVIQMAEQVCAVMKYLHAQEPCILHRDLTPDNMVMTNDGSVVIIDFGAANEFIGTATGTLVGKQSYISPEQFRGKACIQSDIYSFGCTLYFLLTGKDPEPLSVSHPKEVNENISDLLDELVARCTDMDAAARYSNFTEIETVLRQHEKIADAV